jgi:hypothetical protein
MTRAETTLKRRSTLLGRVVIAIGLSLLAGCETEGRSPLVAGGTGDTALLPGACTTPNEGCPCSNEGQELECSNVIRQSTEYATCSQGTRTCSGGRYTACIDGEGAGSHTVALAAGTGRRLMALGTSQSCASTNPCDPDCNIYTDNATGITIPAGDDVTLGTNGVTLIQSETPATGTPCSALTLSPASPTLTITQFSPISPATQQFTAALSPTGCYPGTPPVVWAIDRFDIATISSTGLLTMISPNAGPIVVTGYAGSLSATMTLNVKLAVVDTSAAPSGTSGSFTSTTGSSDTAAVLYPYADTVLPLGLLPPLVQWNTGTTGAAAAVKLSVRYPATGAAIFDWSQIIAENRTLSLNPPTNTVTLATGPRAQIPAAVWTAFERTAKGQDALIVLQRLTGTTTTTLRSEIKTPIHFGTGQLKGTVYYQSYGTNLVQNFSSTYGSQTIGGGQRFGAATLAIQPGATYPTVAAGYTSSSDGPGCRVCHTAASGGSTIVTNLYGSADTAIFRLGVDTANGGLAFPAKNDGKYAWSAVYPDGSFIFGNSGPGQAYSLPTAVVPGGLEDTATCNSNSTSPCTTALNGLAPPNSLYSLAPATIGNVVVSTGIPSALRATMPVFSPDGTRLAFNHYAGTVGTVTGDKRSIGLMDFNNSTKTFSNFRRLVNGSTAACSSAFGITDPCTNVWPTILPGNEGVVYEREIFNNGRVAGAGHSDFGGTRSGCDGSGTCGDDGTKADLWWVTTASTPVAAQLKQANGLRSDGTLYVPTGSNSHTTTNEPVLNYEPTMSPTPVGGYYWLAFTSRRLYGNVATVNPWWSDPRFKAIGGQFGPTTKKIWISAIDRAPASGGDPSHPPFYLPGQELLSGNSKAYWVLNSCVTAASTRSTATECESDLDCCNAPANAVCSLQTPVANPAKRHCIPVTSSSCIADDSATQCSSDAQCCGFSTGSRCANGVCKLPAALLTFSPGDYVRDFHAECPSSTRPVWQVFQWQGKLPTGTSMVFTAATATTTVGLTTATFVAAGTALPPDTTTWATNSVNIEQNLKAIGQRSRDYLRVKMLLNPTSDRLLAPTLTTWRVLYDCVDAE